MKYEVLFEAPGCGVWSLHETQSSAEKHITLLKRMTPTNNRWSILDQGVEIKNNRKIVKQ